MLGDVVTQFRIDGFACAAAGHPARYSAHRRARGHPHRSGNRSDCRAGDCPGGRAGAGREIVVLELVRGFGIDDFGGAFTCERTRCRTDRRTCSQSDGARDRSADRGTTECTGASANAGADLMLLRSPAIGGIDLFGNLLADQTTCDGADERPRGHADGASDRADCRASQRAAGCAEARADRMRAGLARDRVEVAVRLVRQDGTPPKVFLDGDIGLIVCRHFCSSFGQ